jgi:VanZ family protein
MLFSHGNTRAIVEPFFRWVYPKVSSEEIYAAHNLSRKFGHFVIPALAFLVLVNGPLRKRPLAALLVCAIFAFLDEGLQTFVPGRSGSIYDVALDVSGALFGFFVYGALDRWRRGKEMVENGHAVRRKQKSRIG